MAMSLLGRCFVGKKLGSEEAPCRADRVQGCCGCRIEKLEDSQSRELAGFAGAEQASHDQAEVVSGHRH